MATYSKLKLSGSTDGKGIKLAHTSNASAETIHTAQATTTSGLGDLITLFAYNGDTVSRILSLGWGGTTDPDNVIKQSIPAQSGLVLVTADGFLWNGAVITAWADAANEIVLYGYVNRIS